MLMQPVSDPVFHSLCQMLPPLSLQDGPWIAGGAARKLWEHKTWITGDVDVFFKDWEQFRQWQAEFCKTLTVQVEDHYSKVSRAEKLNEIVEIWCEKPLNHRKPQDKFYVKHKSENAITYSMPGVPPLAGVSLQMIKCRWASNLQGIWDTFDFFNCEFATDGHTILASDAAAESSLTKTLVLKDSSNTRNLALRTLKYHLYGFESSKETLLAALQQINDGSLVWDNQY